MKYIKILEPLLNMTSVGTKLHLLDCRVLSPQLSEAFGVVLRL